MRQNTAYIKETTEKKKDSHSVILLSLKTKKNTLPSIMNVEIVSTVIEHEIISKRLQKQCIASYQTQDSVL